MKKIALIAGFCLLQSTIFSADNNSLPTPNAALQLLLDGNKRFINGTYIHKNLTQEALDLKSGQEPFAVIVGCSDSRVPPEIVFDQGPGELFVVRDAGNVIGPIESDSVLYAVEKLHVPLVLILGHENCGAVTAALQGEASAPEISNIYPLIAPALKKCANVKKDILITAIKCNVKQGVDYLLSLPQVANLIRENKLRVVGAYYDFDHRNINLIE